MAVAMVGLSAMGCKKDEAPTGGTPPSTAIVPVTSSAAGPEASGPGLAELVDWDAMAGPCLSVGGSGVLQPGSGNSGLGNVTATGDGGAGVRINVEGLTSELPGAARVIAGARPGFRRCYQKELDEGDATASGRIELEVLISPTGEVSEVKRKATGNLGRTVDCVVERLRRAQFDPPEGKPASVKFTLTFEKGK